MTTARNLNRNWKVDIDLNGGEYIPETGTWGKTGKITFYTGENKYENRQHILWYFTEKQARSMLKQLKDYFENQALERKKLTFEEMDERLTTIRRLAHELVNKGPFTSNQIIELLKISSTIDKIRRGELK